MKENISPALTRKSDQMLTSLAELKKRVATVVNTKKADDFKNLCDEVSNLGKESKVTTDKLKSTIKDAADEAA